MRTPLTRRLLAALILGAGLVGCVSAGPGQLPVATAPREATPVMGHIVTPDRQVAALLADIANGATVALIDSVTGQTLVTGVSSAQGAFLLALPATFSPVTGRPYYLEAVKGLAAGGTAHRAGASVARLRTILFPQGSGWSSLSSTNPGDRIEIGWASTAVSAIVGLRGLTPIEQQGLLGKVGALGFTSAGTNIGQADFQAALGLVDRSLQNDQDPLEVIGYDPTTGRYDIKPGNLALFSAFSPAKATPGGVVTFNGQNLPVPGNDVAITLGGQAILHWSTNADRTQLVATLPATACSGNLEIVRGTSSWLGPFVPVAGTVGTLAGGAAGRADGRGRFALFNQLTFLSRTPQGEWLVSDYGNAVLRSVDASGNVSTLRDSNGVPLALNGAVVADADGNRFVADYGNHRILKVTPAGVVSTLAGSGTPAYQDGTGTGASFTNPHSLALDPATGNLFVTDQGNNRIRRVTSGGVVTTLAGGATSGTTDGTGTVALFNAPNAICYDGVGTVYISDSGNNRIRKLTLSTGAVTTLAGSTAGYQDGNGATAQFNYPHAVTVDPSGNVYVGEYTGQRIRRITPAGVVSTLAGTGTAGYKDGALATAQFYGPSGLVLDPAGNLYLADRHNHRIRVIVP